MIFSDGRDITMLRQTVGNVDRLQLPPLQNESAWRSDIFDNSDSVGRKGPPVPATLVATFLLCTFCPSRIVTIGAAGALALNSELKLLPIFNFNGNRSQ